jgi:DDE superfamily endonuclease
MPPLPEVIRLVLAPLAPLFSPRVWRHAQRLRLGAMLAPGARTVPAALRALGWATERRVTHAPHVLPRATWSARQGSRMLLGVLLMLLVPPGGAIVLGADDTLERRSGRKSKAQGGYWAAVCASKAPVLRCCGRQGVAMRRLVPVPWSRRVWALPLLTALCWPAQKGHQPRHKTSVDWVRPRWR